MLSEQAGTMSATNHAQVERHRKVIQDTWNVRTPDDAFPARIKPGNLGLTALTNLKAIARKVPNLVAAQAMFLVRMSFTYKSFEKSLTSDTSGT